MNKLFQIEVVMEERWIPHFVSMLKNMQYYGNIGRSREIAIYADGDGDFRPKFRFGEGMPDITTPLEVEEVQPKRDINGDLLFDAG